MPSADQVPVNSSHSRMQWPEWVVLIAGSTGSALRAVRPPNLHITPWGNSSPNRKVASDSRVIRVCNRPLQERHRTGLSYTRKNESRVSIEGPEVLLEPNSAQAIAVTLHELATNAAKYGALSAAEGQIEI